jgi:hypothetical protein
MPPVAEISRETTKLSSAGSVRAEPCRVSRCSIVSLAMLTTALSRSSPDAFA